MTKLKLFSIASSILLGLAVPAMASVTITSPVNRAEVTSPITLTASADSCSSHEISAIGYSLDNSNDTTIVKDSFVNAEIQSPLGAHILHIKAWNVKGAVCDSEVAVTVVPHTGDTGGIAPPADAISVSNIETLTNWKEQHDPATPGSSNGAMNMVSSPSLNGNARQFVTSYSGSGGELYHISFGDDPSAQNFLYDTWIYIAGSSASLGNIEMDMNQTMANGQTVIFGFQCDGYSGTWDYTENIGTPEHPKGHWLHSKASCSPRKWSVNTWHHVQVQYSRTETGVVTYQTVAFDGIATDLNVTVPSAHALGWGPTLLANFQVDGIGTGSTTIYVDNMTITRW